MGEREREKVMLIPGSFNPSILDLIGQACLQRRLGNVVLIVGVHVPSEKIRKSTSKEAEALRYWQRQLATNDRMAQPLRSISPLKPSSKLLHDLSHFSACCTTLLFQEEFFSHSEHLFF